MTSKKCDDDKVFAEWTRQVFEQVRHTQTQVEALGGTVKDCKKCMEKRIAELERKIAVMAVKVGGIIAAVGIAIGYILKHLELR